ncbi:MAG: Gfo/Idh/MocA family oxidoreductase [Spirochaetales bacterium]
MVKIGIIGTGSMAEYQAKKFSRLPNCILWACKDQHPEHAADFSSRFSIPYWYNSIEDMLSETENACDAYTCTVLDEHHGFIGKKILNLPKPLLMEKPLAQRLKDTEELANLSLLVPTPALINFSKRNNPALWALREVLHTHYLGSLVSIEAEYLQSWVLTKCWGDWLTTPRWKWRLQPSKSTAGVLGDLGSHLVDALLLLFQEIKPEGEAYILTLPEAMKIGTIPSIPIEQDFLSEPGPVPIYAFTSVKVCSSEGDCIPGTIKLSWIESNTLDAFKIYIKGSYRTAVLDLSLSKDSIEIIDNKTGFKEYRRGKSLLSTYELFLEQIRLYIEGNKKVPNDIPLPDFLQGFKVQKTLDTLFSGKLLP